MITRRGCAGQAASRWAARVIGLSNDGYVVEAGMDFKIRSTDANDIALLAEIIRTSFQDVAHRFNLTPANCPTHPSNCAPEWIETGLGKGIRYYVLESDGVPCGCVALERASPEKSYLERLAVLPNHRKHGYGKRLVEHVLDQARGEGTKRVELAIIAEHWELREWYERQGFQVFRTAEYAHLPFKVAFLFMEIHRP